MRRFDDERGVALITAILVTMIVALFAVTVVRLSIHNEDTSSYDRKRLESVNAAEAGIDYAFNTIQNASTSTLPCTIDADTTSTPPSHYHVTVTYYPSWPASG